MTITRRNFNLGSVAALGALAAPAIARAEGTTIVVNGSGGSLETVIRDMFELPFTEQTGIKVRASAPVSLPKLKAMVESGNVEWDLTELNGDDVVIATKNGWLEELDYSIIDPEGLLPKMAKEPTALVRASYSTVLAYRTDRYKGDQPSSWADFWDVERFPGPRSFENSPKGTLEFALLAEGVAPEDLYPLDVERALSKLDEIKAHIPVWWSTGAQHVQLLIDGEVNMTSCWNGRISPLQTEGKPVAITFNEGALMLSYMGMPKGAPHPKEAMEFLKFRLNPKLAADFVKVVPYPGFVPGMFDYLEPDFVETLPTAPKNAAAQFKFNSQWWAENLEEVTERWTEWTLL